jgi:hypothetical protein
VLRCGAVLRRSAALRRGGHRRRCRTVLAADEHRAAVGTDRSGEDLDQRALAMPRAPSNENAGALLYFKGQMAVV